MKMAKNVIPVIHVGGRIGQDDNGVLSYLDGEVHTFDAVDPETLCKSALERMAKSLGFPVFSAMYWLEPTAMNHEFGLLELNGDRDMDELRNRILTTGCVDFEVFFEHPISEPIIAEEFEVAGDGGCVNLNMDEETKSSSYDSYESAEDRHISLLLRDMN
ncbi:hypothetical protein PIB30_011349 [Stylosanthes scabra]|uniref:PB1-like domain-containing protein n=1 Tax=Stylosanthes scabra TaxID=79078 RepID=A0ABU6X6F9_9FABA|nr:hypothetical protein [Stylosanthes scabra]